MKIESRYVTFEQAKLLKEKRFDVPTIYFWGKDMKIIRNYANHQKLNFNGFKSIYNQAISRPEQWQVVEWLRVNHGIWTHVHLEVKIKGLEISNTGKYQASINRVNHTSVFGKISEGDVPDGPYRKPQNSPQEAYSEAFDFVLTKLI